jgi:hypothetical protein
MVFHHQDWKHPADQAPLHTGLQPSTISNTRQCFKSSVLKKQLMFHTRVKQCLINFGSQQTLLKSLRHKFYPTQMVSTWFAQLNSRLRPSKMFLLVFVPALVLGYQQASAQTNLGIVSLPQAPQFPQGQDRIRATDGTECSRSTAPRRKYMDVGVVGSGSSGTGVENQYPHTYFPGMTTPPNNQYNRAGGSVYARVVINLDAQDYNIDCGRLFELEIERLRLELEQAKLMGVGKPVAK